MADRHLALVSRVGRPMTRSAQQSPCVPGPKVGRPRSKSVYQPKVKEISKKNPTKQKPENVIIDGTDPMISINRKFFT